MANRVLLNDESAVLEASAALFAAALTLRVPQNGHVLSFEEEAKNFRARRLVRFANELRGRVGLPEMDPLTPAHDEMAHVG